MTTTTPRLFTSLVLVGTLALTGCSSDSENGDTGGSSQGTSSNPADTKDDAAVEGKDNGAKDAGIDPANPPKAIATLTLPDVTGEGVVTQSKVELVRWQKRGKVLQAVFAITPTGTKEKTTAFGAVNWGPTLVDLQNLKQYSAITQLTSGYLTDLVMNETNYLYAGFAIPENTDTIDIGVNSSSLRMEGVKLP